MDKRLMNESDIREEVEKATKTLELLGLSKYEAKTYMALVAHGYGTAETVAETAKIPRTSCYRALENLDKKGLAYSTKGRPRVYTPEPPSQVKKMVQSRLDDTFEKLDMVHEVLIDRGMPQLVYTIMGKSRVIDKIGEMLDTSTHRFILSTPSLSEIRRELDRHMTAAVKRGVAVSIVTAPGQRTSESVEVYRRTGLVATDVISDGLRALIASPDLDACGYTDNPALAEHLENFLRILMEHK